MKDRFEFWLLVVAAVLVIALFGAFWLPDFTRSAGYTLLPGRT